MKKTYLKQLLTALLLLCSTVVSAETYSGTCGTSVNWSLDTETGVLNITGTGEMTNYDYCPWNYYRSKITNVTIGNGVTSIGSYAFSYCTGLTSVTIGNGVTSIGNWAFWYCTSLTSVTIPNSVTSIGGSAFSYCTGLTSVEIPNSVTSIGGGAFYGCTGLTSVTIPNSVTTIEGGVFDYTGWYKNQPNGLLYLDGWLLGYKGYAPTGALKIDEGTKGIADDAFISCSGLTSITIPNSVTTIGMSAFEYCYGLTSITIPNSVTSIGSGAFNYTGWYNNQPNGLLYLDGWLLGYKDSEPTGALTINEGTKGITGYAFYYCTGLTSITIPNSVTSIGYRAFYYCTGLTSITIPNSVTSIGESAFYYCTGLTSITIGNGVTIIEYSAFEGCSGITEIYSLAETPATISSATFQNYSATLYVPIGTKAAYQAADYWKNFTNIVEMDFTGIEDIEADGGNAIHGAKDAYYDLNGRRVENPIKGCIYIINGKKVVW